MCCVAPEDLAGGAAIEVHMQKKKKPMRARTGSNRLALEYSMLKLCVGKLKTAYLQRQNTWEENRCPLLDRDLSCCVEPIPMGSKEQTTLANHQSTIHCPLFPPRTSDPTASRKRRGLAFRKRLAVLTVKRSDRLVVLCAARTADGGRSSVMTARLP